MIGLRGSAGASLAEALVGLLLGLGILHVGLTTLTEVRDAYASLTGRLDALTSGRIARTVLRQDLARGVVGVDWWGDSDSLRLRAFRGTGVVCAAGRSANEVVVAYRGDRLPDPAKDSLEVTTGEGVVHPLDLSGSPAAAVTCPGTDSAEVALRLTAAWAIPPGALFVRVFESGSYHLTGSALRYRVGSGGRQPLTPEVWVDGGTGFLHSDSTLRIRWQPAERLARPASEFLGWVPP